MSQRQDWQASGTSMPQDRAANLSFRTLAKRRDNEVVEQIGQRHHKPFKAYDVLRPTKFSATTIVEEDEQNDELEPVEDEVEFPSSHGAPADSNNEAQGGGEAATELATTGVSEAAVQAAETVSTPTRADAKIGSNIDLSPPAGLNASNVFVTPQKPSSAVSRLTPSPMLAATLVDPVVVPAFDGFGTSEAASELQAQSNQSNSPTLAATVKSADHSGLGMASTGAPSAAATCVREINAVPLPPRDGDDPWREVTEVIPSTTSVSHQQPAPEPTLVATENAGTSTRSPATSVVDIDLGKGASTSAATVSGQSGPATTASFVQSLQDYVVASLTWISAGSRLSQRATEWAQHESCVNADAAGGIFSGQLHVIKAMRTMLDNHDKAHDALLDLAKLLPWDALHGRRKESDSDSEMCDHNAEQSDGSGSERLTPHQQKICTDSLLAVVDWQAELGAMDGFCDVAQKCSKQMRQASRQRLASVAADYQNEHHPFLNSDSCLWVAGKHEFQVVADTTEEAVAAALRSDISTDGERATQILEHVSVLEGKQLTQIVCSHRTGEVMYLTANGEVFTTAAGSKGDAKLVQGLLLENVLSDQKVVSIACGSTHNLALTQTGKTLSWGAGKMGQLGHGTAKEDERVPRQIVALSGKFVLRVACGGQHSLALTDADSSIKGDSGGLYSWGRGQNGRLGHGDHNDKATPTLIRALRQSSISEIACGWNFSMAVDISGGVFAFGRSDTGQCGVNSVEDQLLPAKIPEFLCSSAIACGYTHVVAVARGTGRLFSWGGGESGQLGLGETMLSTLQPSAVDMSAIFAQDVGDDKRGTAQDRTFVAKVWCGMFMSMCRTENHRLFGWGQNMDGCLGLGHSDAVYQPEVLEGGPPQVQDVACGNKMMMVLGAPTIFAVSSSSPHSPSSANNAGAGSGGTEAATTPTKVTGVDARFAGPSYMERGRPMSVGAKAGKLEKREQQLLKLLDDAAHQKHTGAWGFNAFQANASNSKLEKFIFGGIPHRRRAETWALMIGNGLKITKRLYRLHRDKAFREYEAVEDKKRPNCIDAVDRAFWSFRDIRGDVNRTFGSVGLFKDPDGEHSKILFRHSLLWWSFRRDYGFVQGMTYPCALIVLVCETDEFAGFRLLANLFSQHHFLSFYERRGIILEPYYRLFSKLLQTHASHSAKLLHRLEVPPHEYLYNWFQPVFCQHLPLQLALRVFDNFLFHGIVFLYKVAVAVVRLLTPALEKMEDGFAAAILLKQVCVRQGREWKEAVTEKSLFAEIDRLQLRQSVLASLHAIQERDTDML